MQAASASVSSSSRQCHAHVAQQHVQRHSRTTHPAAQHQQRAATACSAASVAAAAAAGLPYRPQQQQQRQQSHHHHAAATAGAIRRAHSYQQLLELLQDCGREALTADTIRLLLFQASRLARSAATTTASDSLAAQQLVCACLQLLLQVNEQVSGRHLSSCLLSLGVLCGRAGPAAPVMAGGAGSAAATTTTTAADAAAAASLLPSLLTTSSQPAAAAAAAAAPPAQHTAGVLQQLLLSPARSSRGDLEALLQATGPQHQLQQLLHVTRATAIASAQPGQLVEMLYGLAVLPLRPAPDVLGALLQGLHDRLQRQQQQQHHSPSAAAAARGGGDAFSPKQLSQLLWAAATLQLHLPAPWLLSYLGASLSALPLYGAQDVANTVWALASLKQQQQQQAGATADLLGSSSHHDLLPPAWQRSLLSQVSAVADSLTSQGVGNTLWGLAVLQMPVGTPLLQQLLGRALQGGSRMQPQEFAQVVWGAARCLQHADDQQDGSAEPAAAAECRQQLQALLQQHGVQLAARFLPQHWSNIVWAAGLVGVQPGKTLLQALWHKTPAGFSTSLNPHYTLAAASAASAAAAATVSATNGSSSSANTGRSAGAAAVQAALLNPTRWSPQALANTLWGCARLRVVPPRVWLQGFEAAAVAVLPGFSDQQLANTLWALGELRQRPSEGWLLLFWQQAAGMVQQLAPERAAAADACSQQQQLQQHVVMVLQACSRLGVQPPPHWLQAATQGLLGAAAQLQRTGLSGSLPAQDVAAAALRTHAAAVHALAGLSRTVTLRQRRNASSSSSDSSRSDRSTTTAVVAASAGQQLLRLLVAGGSSGQTEASTVLQQLAAEDVLALLLSLPLLQHPSAAATHSIGASLLLRASPLQHRRSPSQLAQLAYAAAAISSSTAGPSTLWHHLQAAQQQHQLPAAGEDGGTAAAIATATAFVDQLAVALTRHCSSMSAVDLRFSLAAMAQLQQSLHHLQSAAAVRTAELKQRQQQKGAPSSDVAAFAAAAGAAVGAQMGTLTPHQRSVAAVSLAALGFSPQPSWLDGLLHFSSCDLSGSSNGDLVRLVRGLTLLLANTQKQQLRGSGSSNSSRSGKGRLPPACRQMLQEWLADWLSESERRMASLSTAQLVSMAQGLARLGAVTGLSAAQQAASGASEQGDVSASAGVHKQLTRLLGSRRNKKQQQEQQEAPQIPASWQAAFLQAAAARAPEMCAPELLMLLTAVRRLGLSPGQEWCAAVVADSAAVAQAAGAASGSSSGGLRVHHVGWLALSLSRLGCVTPAEQQGALLQFVASACEEEPSAAATGEHQPVGPRQLWQLLLLLAAAGWTARDSGADNTPVGWVQRVQGSAAGARLRAWLGQRTHLGSWKRLWGAL